MPHIPKVGRVATLIHFSPLRGDGHLLHLSHSVAIPIYFSVGERMGTSSLLFTIQRAATPRHFSVLRADGHLLHSSQGAAIPSCLSFWRIGGHLLLHVLCIMLYHTILSGVTMYSALYCCTILYSGILYYITLYDYILYYTIP